jgi:RNA polymerase sigma factor (sigma-70 family)
MVDAGWTTLREVLVESYDDLARRLTRRLRSSELAHEALQDTYLRLQKEGKIGTIDQPLYYLLRIATNLARDRQRAERSHMGAEQIEAALEIVDDHPDPARIVEARSELAIVEQALGQMSVRTRAIFLAAWKEHLTSKEIARRYDVSVRLIDMELKRGREICAEAIRKLYEK